MEQGSTKVLHLNPKDKEEKTVYPEELGKITKHNHVEAAGAVKL